MVVGHTLGIALLPAFTVACALLVLAGLSKLRSPEPARDALRAIGLRPPPAAVRVLGAAEVVLAAFAAARPGPVTASLVAFAYATFAVAIVLLLRADGAAGCGCFGAASSVASPVQAALNALVCGVAVLSALARPPAIDWVTTRTPLVAITLVVGTATAVFAAYAAFTLFAPAWRAYGSGSGA